MPDALTEKLQQGCDALGLSLQASQIQQLLDYLELLLKWNKAFNLSAIRDAEEAINKHLLDSLSMVQEMQAGKQYLDIGAGAGLPGIPSSHCLPRDTRHHGR